MLHPHTDLPLQLGQGPTAVAVAVAVEGAAPTAVAVQVAVAVASASCLRKGKGRTFLVLCREEAAQVTTVVRQVVTAAIPSVEAVEVCPLTVVMRQELQHLQLGQGPAAVTVQQQQF